MAKVRELLVKITGSDAELSKALDRSARNVDALGKRMSRIGTSLSKYITAPLTAAAGGLLLAANRAAEFADTIDKTAIRTGVAREELQRLKYATGQMGVEFEAIEATILGFSRNLPTIQKESGRAHDALVRLGVSAKDGAGKLRPMAEIFPEIVKGLSQIPNETERNALGFQLFGRRVGELLPLMAKGGMELERLMKRADELGVVMSDEGIRQLVAYKDAMAELKDQGGAVAREFVLSVLPVLKDQLIPFVQNSVVPWFRHWAGVFRQIPPETVRTAAGIALVVAALPPMIALLGTATRAVAGLISAAAFLKGPAALAGLAAIATPGGALLVGLAAVAAAFAHNRVEALRTAMATATLRAEMAALGQQEAWVKLEETRAALEDVGRALDEAKQKAADARNAKGGMLGNPADVARTAQEVSRLTAERDRLITQGRALVASINRHAAASRSLSAAVAPLGDEVAEVADKVKEKKEKLSDAERALERFGTSLAQAAALQALLGDEFDRGAAEAAAYRDVVHALAAAGTDLNAVVGPQGETLRALAERYLELQAAVDATSESTRRRKDLEQEAARVAESVRTAEEVRTDTVARLNEMLAAGAITQETYNRAVAEADRVLAEAGKKGREVRTEMERMAAGGLDAVTDWATGSRQAISSFARQAIQDLARVAARAAILRLLLPGGAAAGGIGGFLAKALGAPGRASGGPVTAHRPYWVGERGPELIVPRTGGTVIPTHALAAAGGAPSLTLNVPPASDPITMARDSQWMRAFSEMMQEWSARGGRVR